MVPEKRYISLPLQGSKTDANPDILVLLTSKLAGFGHFMASSPVRPSQISLAPDADTSVMINLCTHQAIKLIVGTRRYSQYEIRCHLPPYLTYQ